MKAVHLRPIDPGRALHITWITGLTLATAIFIGGLVVTPIFGDEVWSPGIWIGWYLILVSNIIEKTRNHLYDWLITCPMKPGKEYEVTTGRVVR